MSGCFLLLSSNIGNKDEFAAKSNSYIFNPRSTLAIKNALESAMSLSQREFSIASKLSEILGKKNNYKNSLNEFKKIISKCLEKK